MIGEIDIQWRWIWRWELLRGQRLSTHMECSSEYLLFINVFTNRGKVQKTFVYSVNNFLSYWYSGNSFSSALSSVHRLTFVIISIFQDNFYFLLPFRFTCWTTTQCRLWLMWWECWRRLLLTLLLSALRSFVQMISEYVMEISYTKSLFIMWIWAFCEFNVNGNMLKARCMYYLGQFEKSLLVWTKADRLRRNNKEV